MGLRRFDLPTLTPRLHFSACRFIAPVSLLLALLTVAPCAVRFPWLFTIFKYVRNDIICKAFERLVMIQVDIFKEKKKCKGAYSSSWNSPQNYGTSLVNRITQYYLLPDRGAVVKIDCSKRLAFLLYNFKLISNQQQLISKTDTCPIDVNDAILYSQAR